MNYARAQTAIGSVCGKFWEAHESLREGRRALAKAVEAFAETERKLNEAERNYREWRDAFNAEEMAARSTAPTRGRTEDNDA